MAKPRRHRRKNRATDYGHFHPALRDLSQAAPPDTILNRLNALLASWQVPFRLIDCGEHEDFWDGGINREFALTTADRRSVYGRLSPDWPKLPTHTRLISLHDETMPLRIDVPNSPQAPKFAAEHTMECWLVPENPLYIQPREAFSTAADWHPTLGIATNIQLSQPYEVYTWHGTGEQRALRRQISAKPALHLVG